MFLGNDYKYCLYYKYCLTFWTGQTLLHPLKSPYFTQNDMFLSLFILLILLSLCFISLKQHKLQFFQNVSIISTVQRTSCKSDRYTYCLYYKYCLENFENVSIIRPVQRQFQEHYKYKYCLYYKYCFSFIEPFSWTIAMFKTFIVFQSYIFVILNEFWH